MKRNKFPIGPVSESTTILVEVVENWLWMFGFIELSTAERAIINSISERSDRDGYDKSSSLVDDYNDLIDIANEHVPTLCYAGVSYSDPACYGVWVDRTAAECEFTSLMSPAEMQEIIDDPTCHGAPFPISRRNDLRSLMTRAIEGGVWIEVNDHGNMTCHVLYNGVWTVEWSMV